MFILIVYDISDNDVRRRLSEYLKAKGFTRIQRSAFIGRPMPTTLRDVERFLWKFIKGTSDVIHLFPITENTLKYAKTYGSPASIVHGDEEEYVVI
ncbi:MAG: CRISPR-associated endonuclease Cas2 [Sulfolobales archaeon]|nr:CRISPR-associated endonuclease Cas2 [Sulfolobales archaeon]